MSTDAVGQTGLPPSDVHATATRAAVYVIPTAQRFVDDAIWHALAALRSAVTRLVVVAPSDIAAADLARLSGAADQVLVSDTDEYDDQLYRWAIEQAPGDEQEVVLTGASWFGPVAPFAPVLERTSAPAGGAWAMLEDASGGAETFPDEGFTEASGPWVWTAVARPVIGSVVWRAFWSRPAAAGTGEQAFHAALRAAGRTVSHAFPAAEFPTADPGLFAVGLTIDAGCPIVRRDVFTRYPPFLDRFAVVGRQLLQRIAETGYPVAAVLQSLTRSMPLKALYANAGLLEVLPGSGARYDPTRPQRIAAVVHVTDFSGVAEVLDRLDFLPEPYDLYLTTTDGKRATELQRLVGAREASRIRRVDVRVTAADRGRDMSDLFVGCRDVLLSGDYDLIVKLHARRARRKTVNVRRYFRRYQYENLLDSPGHAADLLALFQREPGLGVVFPPMIHIGYTTMGHGWAGLRTKAQELAQRLGIRVPLDEISPLAPLGGMWVSRPQALELVARHRWRYSDYQRGSRGDGSLARVQERMIAYAAGELGFHSRCVLTPEHAAISHTAIEFKTDSLFTTTRGWPVEQIRLMHRAGATGHGGVVALSRMYVRLNHPRASRVLMPVYEVALRGVVALRFARRGGRDISRMMRGLPMERHR